MDKSQQPRKPRPMRTCRLVLAVTGHRTLKGDDKALRLRVKTECERLSRQHSNCAYTLISSLAEGADRLVTDVVLATLGARLIVPLPLPLADRDGYCRDFPASLDQFQRMLTRADEVFVAPIRSRSGEWRRDGPARDRQYAWSGAYAVEHAQVLFAIWNGRPARGIGGTAQVVQWFLNARVPRAFSTLALKLQRGTLPPAIPKLLVHINPETGDVVRLLVRKSRTSD